MVGCQHRIHTSLWRKKGYQLASIKFHRNASIFPDSQKIETRVCASAPDDDRIALLYTGLHLLRSLGKSHGLFHRPRGLRLLGWAVCLGWGC